MTSSIMKRFEPPRRNVVMSCDKSTATHLASMSNSCSSLASKKFRKTKRSHISNEHLSSLLLPIQWVVVNPGLWQEEHKHTSENKKRRGEGEVEQDFLFVTCCFDIEPNCNVVVTALQFFELLFTRRWPFRSWLTAFD